MAAPGPTAFSHAVTNSDRHGVHYAGNHRIVVQGGERIRRRRSRQAQAERDYPFDRRFRHGILLACDALPAAFGELKIDKCFVMELERDPARERSSNPPSKWRSAWELKVTAEGVETDSTFAQLRLIGCDDAQGWFISKSLPADEIPSFFAGWKKTRGTPGDGNPSFASKLAAIQNLLDEAAMPGNANETLMLSATQFLEPDASILDIVAAIPPLALQGRLLPRSPPATRRPAFSRRATFTPR